MGVDHPWTGVGLGRFEAAYPAYGPPVSGEFGVLHVEHPHAEPLEVFAESGLPGLLALAWIACSVVSVLVRLARSSSPWHRRAALALGLSVIALGVDAMSGFPLRTALAPLVLALVLGLCSRLDRAAVPLPAPRPRPRALAGVDRGARRRPDRRGCGRALARAPRRRPRVARDGARRARWTLRRCRRRRPRRRTARPAPDRAARARAGRAARRAPGRRPVPARPRPLRAPVRRDGCRDAWLGALGRRRPGGRPRELAARSPARCRPSGDPAACGADPAPHSSSTSACTGRVTVSVASDGGVALVAHAELLSDVLKCVGSRTGLRIDYDGPQPRQRITVEIASGPLPSSARHMFEGLGLNYVLSTGAGQVGGGDRLIVSGVSGGPAPRAASSTDQPAPPAPGAEPTSRLRRWVPRAVPASANPIPNSGVPVKAVPPPQVGPVPTAPGRRRTQARPSPRPSPRPSFPSRVS